MFQEEQVRYCTADNSEQVRKSSYFNMDFDWLRTNCPNSSLFIYTADHHFVKRNRSTMAFYRLVVRERFEEK